MMRERTRKVAKSTTGQILAALTCLALASACGDTIEKKGENNTSPNVVNGTTVNNVVANNIAENNSTSVDPGKIDLLWVIDNSGSMCQEQQSLRNNLDAILAPLYDDGVDFQIGITTTQMRADYVAEPIAQPGRLQSTPQPVPGFDPTCLSAINEQGQVIVGDYQPIRDAVAFAATCAGEDPANYQWSDADIECVIQGGTDCSVCGGGSCSFADIMPSEFPEFPKVFRSGDYADANAMAEELACATFVGTRGYGIEKGLEAAVAATSLELTGGAVDADGADTGAPNHGLLRSDARFGLFFFTDENDCSHDGTLDETSPCGGSVCDYANSLDAQDSPLLPIQSLREDLFANLSESKGRAVGAAEVLVASFHGRPARLESAPADVPSVCQDASWEPPAASCVGPTFGAAYSGDRYSRFLAGFGSQYPAASGGEVEGSICLEDLRPRFEGMANYITSNL